MGQRMRWRAGQARAAENRRPIGFQIKGVQALIQKFGWDGLGVETESNNDPIGSISVVALLLGAHEEGPKTVSPDYSAVVEILRPPA